jgi:O-antigen/teichoic acid export membrane protein
MKKDGTHTYAFQIATHAISVAMLVVSAHFLGPSQRGVYAAVMTIGTVAGVVFSISLGKTLLFELAHVPEGERSTVLGRIASVVARLVGIMTALAVAALAAVFALWSELFGSVSARLLMIASLALPCFIWQNVATHLYALSNDNLKLIKITFWFRAATLAAALWAFLLGWIQVDGYVAIVAASMLLEFAWGLAWSIQRAGGLGPLDWALAGRLLTNGAKVHLDSIGNLLTLAASILVLNYYVSAEELGYFSVASQFVAFLMIGPMVGSRYVHTLVAHSGAAVAWPLQRQLMARVLGGSAALCTVGFALFWLVITWLLPRFEPAAAIAAALLPTVLLSGFSTMMNPQWLAWGRFGLMSALGLVHGVLSLCITIVAVQRFGIWGAAWAMILSSGLAFGVNLWVYLRLNEGLGFSARGAGS